MENDLTDNTGAAPARLGWFAWEEIGIGQIHLDDMVLSGAATKELDENGKLIYRVKMANCPDIIYHTKK